MSTDAFGTVLFLFTMILMVAFVAAYAVSLVWLYRDAQARGKTGCMWLLIAFFTWPFGVLAYYLLRDKTVTL